MSRTATRELNLTRRHVALLDAIATGRAQLTCSRAPDIYVDGLCCTDHAAAGELARLGLVVAAELTPAGAAARRAHLASVGHG